MPTQEKKNVENKETNILNSKAVGIKMMGVRGYIKTEVIGWLGFCFMAYQHFLGHLTPN